MGRKTYEQALTFGDWYYKDKECFIFSRDTTYEESEHGTFISPHIPTFVQELKEKSGNNIWMMGGAHLATEFLRHRAIDELHLFMHPVVLGDGIPIFTKPYQETWLTIKHTNIHEQGLLEIQWERKK